MFGNGMNKINLIRQLIALLVLFASPCSAIDKSRNFSFDFGYGENQGIEILNYKYGDSIAGRPLDSALASGHIGQSLDLFSDFPPGDVLYVKWRVLSSGKIYEDTVDLKNRMPSDMYHKLLHFSIVGPQLYVYIIAGKDATIEGNKIVHVAGFPDCPVALYKDKKCARIYPDQWKNF